jgi:hypothetical protein
MKITIALDYFIPHSIRYVLPPQTRFYESFLIKVHTRKTGVIDIQSTLSKTKRKRKKVSTDGGDVPKTPATMQRAISKTLR